MRLAGARNTFVNVMRFSVSREEGARSWNRGGAEEKEDCELHHFIYTVLFGICFETLGCMLQKVHNRLHFLLSKIALSISTRASRKSFLNSSFLIGVIVWLQTRDADEGCNG